MNTFGTNQLQRSPRIALGCLLAPLPQLKYLFLVMDSSQNKFNLMKEKQIDTKK